MLTSLCQQAEFIHRHTGGLENEATYPLFVGGIHRHTGGLENWQNLWIIRGKIHRHTGGLEILYSTM